MEKPSNESTRADEDIANPSLPKSHRCHPVDAPQPLGPRSHIVPSRPSVQKRDQCCQRNLVVADRGCRVGLPGGPAPSSIEYNLIPMPLDQNTYGWGPSTNHFGIRQDKRQCDVWREGRLPSADIDGPFYPRISQQVYEQCLRAPRVDPSGRVHTSR